MESEAGNGKQEKAAATAEAGRVVGPRAEEGEDDAHLGGGDRSSSKQ